MPLSEDFDLYDHLMPVLVAPLTEPLSDLKENIESKLGEVLPRNEYLVKLDKEPGYPPVVSAILFVKVVDEFKVVEFKLTTGKTSDITEVM